MDYYEMLQVLDVLQSAMELLQKLWQYRRGWEKKYRIYSIKRPTSN